MSLTCFQYLRVGTEEVADRAPVVAAGRTRGADLVKELGLVGSATDAARLHELLDAALGVNGTRLCLITSITETASGGYEVRLTEGACTAGQMSETPLCAFTLGVFVGAIQALSGRTLRARETACCACGAPECVYQLDPL
jgi:predicted hydrocarbon binding protein